MAERWFSDEELEEKRQMEEALVEYAGNQTRAAEKCGMSRRTFVSRLKEYNLPRPRKRKK